MGFAVGNGVAILMSIWFVHVSAAAKGASIPWPSSCRASPSSPWRLVVIVTLGNGFTTKVVMTALITFFPTLVNMMRGLAAVDVNMLQLFKSVDASRWKVLAKLRWPTSLPYLFAGLRITASVAHDRRHHRRVDR